MSRGPASLSSTGSSRAGPLERPRGPSRAPRPRLRGGGALSVAEATLGLVCRELTVEPRDVVFVKGLVEASDGLVALFAERGGVLTLASTPSQERDLDAFVSDVREALTRSSEHA